MKIAIIGGGIIGLATAHQLLEHYPMHQVVVLEKENLPGRHQSTHNSGVLHAGLYYKPGSLKAKLAVKGIRQMKAFCEKHSIPHETCGKLVVATDETEINRLEELFNRGKQNGLVGLEKCSSEAMKEIEPHVRGVAAVRVPEEGIVDYDQVCIRLGREITERGGRVNFGFEVKKIKRKSKEWRINHGDSGAIHADFIINTAGLHCDRICALTGRKPRAKIIPFRGEYYKIREERSYLVKNLIYPVPDPKFPFLGVHFTRLVHGGIEAGPNAVLALKREGYSKTDVNLHDALDALLFPGLWKFGAKHLSMCWSEIRRSLSKELFCKALQRLVPEVEMKDLTEGGAGVRAQAMNLNGTLEQDFVIERGEGMLHVLNAPSPGATASLAIADHLIDEIKQDLN